MDILKRNNEFVFPCGKGEILHEGQPLSTVVYRAASDLMSESQQHSAEEKEEARDPDPDVEARQDSWSLMGDCIFRIHGAPRTKISVPKKRFSDASELH